MSVSADDLLRRAERDGYFVIPSFFGTDDIGTTRGELVAILEEDLARREAKRVPKHHREAGRAVSALTPHMHTVHFPLWKSGGLRELATRLFTDGAVREVARRVIGEHFRLRVDLVRRSTGTNDRVDEFELPHAWHRDTPGEFTFGIFFDDLSRPNSGGTAVIPGSHWRPQHPLWDLALSEKSRVSKERYLEKDGPQFVSPRLYRFMLANRLLRRRLQPHAVEIRGKPGDVYFFINDLWHGRAPNVHGGQNVMVRMGGFASEFEFKDDLGLPEQGPDVLPDVLARHYSPDQPANDDPTTVLRRIQRRRRSVLPAVAAREKQLAVRVQDRRRKGEAPTASKSV